MNAVPLYTLPNKTGFGLELKRFVSNQPVTDNAAIMSAHRDDHYNFVYFEKGTGFIMTDFNKIRLSAGTLFFILPNQIHSRVRYKKVDGWHLAVETALIPPECRNVFESQLSLQKPALLQEMESQQCQTLLRLLNERYTEQQTDAFHTTIIHGLLQSFVAIAAIRYKETLVNTPTASRLFQITSGFKKLLLKAPLSSTKPADYAAMLHVSEPYLAEAVRKTTGFPVSYWIQQEVMLEAKRLLYYSQHTVKDIANILGYTDHSYFSRAFRKATGMSALAFRAQYQK